MQIGGLQKTSLLDYPDRISVVIFTCGCNLMCNYCHNPHLVVNPEPTISEDDVINFLERRKKYIEAVVVTGGEPTIHPDLPDFLRKIKGLGYTVKLDTNGTNPDALENLIKDSLVDYIAMDVKAPAHMYSEISDLGADESKIRKSINIIMNSGIEYEFRTTVYPKLSKEHFRQMLQMIKGAKRYYLQQFEPRRTLKKEDLTPFDMEKLHEIEDMAKEFVQEVGIRNAGY
jgi:pyruvate formate lyase activating enzyme